MDNTDTVPVEDVPADKRIDQLEDLFVEEFRRRPNFYVRVPGRVNLIGEHIDYCGYPVLPMALEQDILVAVGLTEDSRLILRNTEKKYVDYDSILTTSDCINIKNNDGGPIWYNYVLCGIKGALEHVQNKFTRGVILYINGNIPPASGLSSSSALVSAACLSFLHAQGITLNKTNIASLCAKSERYIGTEGGGMDQAIAFLAQSGCAQYITWNPLCASPVSLPAEAAFVVAHSLAEANKAANNDFNQRVMECRLAAKVLMHLSGNSSLKIITLSEVQKILGKSLEDMVKAVFQCLPNASYSKNDICQILEISDNDLNDVYLTENTKHITEFKLQQRAIHVYEEAMRVEKFRLECLKLSQNHAGENGETNGVAYQNGNNNCNTILEKLGVLMSASHTSLKKLYECSHQNLDHLVEISKEMEVHSRLTGAGWGGCIVALCPRWKVEKYVEKMKTEFYGNRDNMKDLNTLIFTTKPNHGAIVYTY